MNGLSDISAELFDRLLGESIGALALDDAQWVDSDAMATANTCFRSCAHTLCVCIVH